MKRILTGLVSLMVAWHANAQLTATVHPGYTFAEGERPTVDTLNQLATPTIDITGTISGTVGLTAQSVTGTHFANSVVDGVTTDFNGSTPRAIKVHDAGIGATQVATNLFLQGLSGGAGTQVRVNVDTNGVTVNSSNNVCLAMPPLTNGCTLNTNGQLILVATNFIAALPNAGGGFTNAHGLGITPGFVRAVLVFTNSGTVLTSQGYQQGDEIALSAAADSNGTFFEPAFVCGADATSVWVKENNNVNLVVLNRLTGVASFINTSRTNWNVKVYVRP